ncbi:MAG: thioesterase [Flavobacteriaceae bacterium]|nr:thioesterase [Flavobacteriaceae bacterium]
MKFFSQPFRIKYSDTDQMGIVHHSNYLKYFENARISWLRSVGVSYKKIEDSGILMPVVSASVEFIYPLYFDDEINIEIILDELPRATLIFDYKIFNQNKKLVCTGNTKLAFLNSITMRPTRVPKNIYNLFSGSLE